MFQIRFQGLITHATVTNSNGDEKQVAVLYTVPNVPHLALLSVSVGDLDPNNPSAPEDYSTGNARCWKLDGVTTTDLSPGIPLNNLVGVASLNDGNISTGSIKNPATEIGDLTPTANFNLLELGDGTLLVRNWFKDLAFFSPKLYPAPWTVGFSAKPTGTYVKFTIDNQTTKRDVYVKPGAIVYVTNHPKVHSAIVTPHWDAMSSFFDPANPVTVTNPGKITSQPFPLGADKDDNHDTCTIPHELSVECSNTQFP